MREDLAQRVAAVQRRGLPAAEVAQQQRALRVDHAGLLQLQQHALDAVRVLADVFEEQQPAAQASPRPVAGAQQRQQHRQVAAPQRAARVEPVEAVGGTKADRLELAGHGLDEGIGGDLVDATLGGAAAEVVDRQRPGPARDAGMRPQRQQQRGEVAVADPARAALDAAREQRPVEAVEQPGEAVAAAGGQRDAGRGGGDAVQRGQPRRVVAGKALVARQRRRVDLHVEAAGLQAPHGQPQRRGAGHRARGREQGQGGHGSRSGQSVSVASPVGIGASSSSSPRGSAGGSRVVRCCARRAWKNSRSSRAQGSASTPPRTWV